MSEREDRLHTLEQVLEVMGDRSIEEILRAAAWVNDREVIPDERFSAEEPHPIVHEGQGHVFHPSAPTIGKWLAKSMASHEFSIPQLMLMLDYAGFRIIPSPKPESDS